MEFSAWRMSEFTCVYVMLCITASVEKDLQEEFNDKGEGMCLSVSDKETKVKSDREESLGGPL